MSVLVRLSACASVDGHPFPIDIAQRLKLWHDLAIVHKGQRVAIGGSTFSRIARIALLQLLQRHCQRLGVELEFERRVHALDEFADCDLVVGADGVRSVVRQTYAEHFQPTLDLRPNKFIWYGTHQPFDAMSLIFRQNDDGAFVAHCYPYSDTTSTFIVECDAPTWAQAGFERMSDAESRAYCEDVFKADLGGHGLLSNKSNWINFLTVSNAHWHYRNVVLIGDALRTIHFSIGSGTRMALEAAIALANAFGAHGADRAAAFADFERSHRPTGDQFIEVGWRSCLWYEQFRRLMHLDPIPFAYSYMTRGGKVDIERLRQRAPDFVAAYESCAE